MKKYPRVECEGCQEGIDMCHHRPCFGTVDQLEKIINAGYAHKLMLDYWSRRTDHQEDIDLLCGANKGCDGGHAPFSPVGTCSLLVDDKCSIYAIRPAEGAWSCCKDEKTKQKAKWREEVVKTWDTPKGKALVKRWKKIVNLKDEKKEPELGEMFELMLDSLGIK